MILESLYHHHRRQLSLANPLYPPCGMELRRVHFLLLLSSDGELIDIEELKDKISVVKSRVRVGKEAAKLPNYFWDTMSYVIGIDTKIHHESFKEMVGSISSEYPENRSFRAVRNFYNSDYRVALQNHHLYDSIVAKKGYNISFRLVGERDVAGAQSELLNIKSDSGHGNCIISGKRAVISRIHPKVYIAGSAGTGARMVSFNYKLGYDSYYKANGDNAPISTTVAESYSISITALSVFGALTNTVIGNISLLYFTDKESGFVEQFHRLFQSDAKPLDTNIKGKFTIIALVPNAARISVRLFIEEDIQTITQNINKFCSEFGSYNLLSLLSAIAPYGALNKLPPQVIIDFIEKVLLNKPFSKQLIQLVAKTDKQHPSVISILKMTTMNNNTNNIGYLLGRILAIVERTQMKASPNASYTVKDSYYMTMTLAPNAIFNRLMMLVGSFTRRIPLESHRIYLQKQLAEVIALFKGEAIPQRLSIEEQNCFVLGYYAQCQIYYIKKNKDDKKDDK